MRETGCRQRILVLGGAGFLGSNIVVALLRSGHKVRVVDGLLPLTGGSERHIRPFLPDIGFIRCRVEETPDLPALLADADAVVDCMGWTCHLLALKNAAYDAELNICSHRVALEALARSGAHPRLIYLGSRGQYGRPDVAAIREDCPMQPVDIQGIHKLTAEHYFRFFSSHLRLSVASLRLPACIGPNQPAVGEDIGLFGGFVRDLVLGRTITVYGRYRRREVVDARDVAEIVRRVVSLPTKGFQAYNVPGHSVPLQDAAQRLRQVAGSGEVSTGELPATIARIDAGDAPVDCDKLRHAIGDFELTGIDEMFDSAVRYFKESLT